MNGSPHAPVAVKYMVREVEMYSFTKKEVLSFRETDGSWQMGIAGIMAGACLSLLVAVITSSGNSPWVFASFIAVAVVTGVLGIVFGIQAFYLRHKSREEIERCFQGDAASGLRHFSQRPGA